MRLRTIDLFAGIGGNSEAAEQAGCAVVWAANHWAEAVEWHKRNHPNVLHACQDLRQADFSQLPPHDMGLASPCCQGHSPARGKDNGNPQYDASRSTAWAVVDAAEHHRQHVWIVENVPSFLKWELYPAWELAMKTLGYAIAPHVIDAADYGAPQHRIRLFLILTRSKHPLRLNIPKTPHKPAREFLDFESGNWSPIERPGRAKATLERVKAGRQRFGDRFLMPYYGNGSGKTGRNIDRPIGTITTRDRWALVDGDRMRMLTRFECRSAMSFRNSYLIPDQHKLAVHMLGNAVCPKPVSRIIQAVKEAA